MSNETGRNVHIPSWTIRRRIIFTSLIFCAAMVAYIVGFGEDTRVNETVVLGCFGLAATIIGSYVFGAVWDDANTARQRDRMSSQGSGGPMY